MFERYGNFSEELRVNILCKNLTPFYIMQLPDVRTVAQLEEECLKLEVKKYRAEHHVLPKIKSSSSVKPNFAYVSTLPDTVTEHLAAAGVSPVQDVTCWNCRQKGHCRQQCPAPKSAFVFVVELLELSLGLVPNAVLWETDSRDP